MRAALGPDPVREPEEVFLVDRVQHRGHRPLDDFVLKSRNRERSLAAVRLGYVDPPGRQWPVCSPMQPCVQVLKLALKVCFVGRARQPIHAGSRVVLKLAKRLSKVLDADVVEERGEPLLLPLPCGLPYAFQRLCHGSPVLHPARALLARIPLGRRPWLHRLRRGSLHVVRRLLSYYGGVRLPASVHHRLRLLAFPMRTCVVGPRRPGAGPPSFRRDPFARDVLFDPGRATMPRMTALLMLRSTPTTVSAPAKNPFRGSITHPTQPLCTLRGRRCRRLTQHSLPGRLLGLTWAGLAPADRASFAGAFRRSG